MKRPAIRRCVLAIAGLDPGGGAGLLADARAVLAAGAFPCGVAAVLTTQSTSGLRHTESVRAKTWLAQARLVLRDQRVGALKIGALGNLANVRAAEELLATHRDLPAVVDPVLLPTRGAARLLEERALGRMRELVARATLVVANAPEAEALTGRRVTDLDLAELAAREMIRWGAGAALVKGGHLTGARAVDVLVFRGKPTLLSAPRLRLRRPVHGGGCILSSLIAAHLAQGRDVVSAVKAAKRTHHAALSRAIDVGGDLLVLIP